MPSYFGTGVSVAAMLSGGALCGVSVLYGAIESRSLVLGVPDLGLLKLFRLTPRVRSLEP